VDIVLVWDTQKIDVGREKRKENTRSIANNYLEVLVDDENTMLE
jgi:hypothetical protein